MTRAKSKSITRRAERRDPIFAAIEAHKRELKKFEDFCRSTIETEETEKQASSLCAAFAAKERALLRTVPTTLEGVTALLAHYVDCGKNGNDLSDVFMDRKLQRHGQMGHEALAETVLARCSSSLCSQRCGRLEGSNERSPRPCGLGARATRRARVP